MPCYNASNTIRDALDSILNLKLTSFEICTVDDCSKDNSYEILKEYKTRYPENIKIGRNDKNLGGGGTRNVCVSMTSSNYIYCLDADNVLDKKSFLRMLENVGNEDIVYYDQIKSFIKLGPFRFVYKKTKFLKDYFTLEDMRKEPNNPVTDGNMLFSRKVFDEVNGYDTQYRALDTFTFGAKILQKGYKIKLVSDTFYFHMISLGSYWFRDCTKNLKILKEYLFQSNLISMDEKLIIKDLEDAKVGRFYYSVENDIAKTLLNPIAAIFLQIFYKMKKLL